MPLPTGRPHITPDTPGPALAVLSICSAGASALVVGSSLAYQFKNKQVVAGSKLGLEWNVLLTLALIVCIAQSALTADQVTYGLGYTVEMLTASDVASFVKLEYVNNILYVTSLLLLKGVQFMLQIATTWDQPNYWVPGGVMLAMLGFLFAVVFECQNPFWDVRGGQCINQSALWYAFGIFDIVSDIYSITVVMMVSKDLNLRTDSKIKLLVILGSKFLPVACAIARLPFIHAAYMSENYTIALYRLSMPTQIQLHLSVVSLSLGRIFRFLAALDVGYLASSIEPTTAKGSKSRSQTARYGSYGKASKNQISRLSQKRSISDHESSKGLVLGREWSRLDGDIPLESQQSNTQISAQWTPKSADAATIGEREIRVTKTIEVTRT